MIDKILLFPYYLILRLRDKFYSKPKRKLFHPEIPTLCVGNVTVGGTGKTPHVEMILRLLGESEYWSERQIAVLSRGYKRESRGFQQVLPEGGAAMFGDEPVQIKRKFPNVVVAVDKDRVEGCELLCHPEKLEQKKYAKKCWNREFKAADYIILDDAFQYRKLRASRTMVLVDYNHPTYKDMLLPLGRLRDLPQRVYDADAIIVTKCLEGIEQEEKDQFVLELGLSDYRPELCEATNPKGRRQTILFSTTRYAHPKPVFPEGEARYVYSKKAVLVTGIAKSSSLRGYICGQYKLVAHHDYADHHKFTWSDINRIRVAIRKNPTAVVLTTEKDAPRIMDFVGLPQEIRERLFVVPIETHFVSEVERSAFVEFISSI